MILQLVQTTFLRIPWEIILKSMRPQNDVCNFDLIKQKCQKCQSNTDISGILQLRGDQKATKPSTIPTRGTKPTTQKMSKTHPSCHGDLLHSLASLDYLHVNLRVQSPIAKRPNGTVPRCRLRTFAPVRCRHLHC